MTSICRQLTRKDENLIPAYLEIFNTQLDAISPFYSETQLKTARENYTLENLSSALEGESEKQFRGHFSNGSLDGVLIEGERNSHLEGKKESLIYWMMAKETGKGIGSDILKDCIERARKTGKAFVYLSVAENNPAKKLYERFGFQVDRHYGEQNQMVLMTFPIEENI